MDAGSGVVACNAGWSRCGSKRFMGSTRECTRGIDFISLWEIKNRSGFVVAEKVSLIVKEIIEKKFRKFRAARKRRERRQWRSFRN